MHVLAPKPTEPAVPMFFNVDASVGFQGANSSSEDIILVQFLLHKVGERVAATSAQGESRRARLLKVPLSGSVDAATIDGIRAFQEQMATFEPGTVVDGRVSSARGYRYGAGHWTIVTMNLIVRKLFPEFWPRLHNATACPPMLKAKTPVVL